MDIPDIPWGTLAQGKLPLFFLTLGVIFLHSISRELRRISEQLAIALTRVDGHETRIGRLEETVYNSES